MEYRDLGTTGLQPSAIGLGTWVMGGWLWGGADDRQSLATIRRAIELGITLIDTAPIYGHGRSEELVGQAIQNSGQRDRIILATKVGLHWDPKKTKVWRDARRVRIIQELEDSLRRLRTDRIDIYQVHWPDCSNPFEQTMETLCQLREQGKIGFIGLSNFNVPQIQRCLNVGPVHVLQPPLNLFERGIEQEILPFCRQRRIGVLAYGSLCRGLLTGKYKGQETFSKGDIRGMDPKFKAEPFRQYLQCVEHLRNVASGLNQSIASLAIRWCLDQPEVSVALCGARTPEQIEESVHASGWALPPQDLARINQIVSQNIPNPIGPEFMGPP